MKREARTDEQVLAEMEQSYAANARLEHMRRIGADVHYEVCGWCGGVVSVGFDLRNLRWLYVFRLEKGAQEFVHPECTDAAAFAEAEDYTKEKP